MKSLTERITAETKKGLAAFFAASEKEEGFAVRSAIRSRSSKQ